MGYVFEPEHTKFGDQKRKWIVASNVALMSFVPFWSFEECQLGEYGMGRPFIPDVEPEGKNGFQNNVPQKSERSDID